MALSTIWWLLAGSLIAVELLTSTFYLLMLSLGAVASALAAHADAPLAWQMVIGACVGGLSVILWHVKKARTHQPVEASHNQDVHLDLGEVVQVLEWDTEGYAQVKHRGAQWTAQLAVGQSSSAGAHRITAMTGNRLVVEKFKPESKETHGNRNSLGGHRCFVHCQNSQSCPSTKCMGGRTLGQIPRELDAGFEFCGALC